MKVSSKYILRESDEMQNSEQFLKDIKEVIADIQTDDRQLIENAKFTMEHFKTTDYIVGGKFTKTGRVAKFIFKKSDDQFEYLSFVQDEPFTEIEGE
ncbi:hypothetical protein P7D86_20975 [Enterococcus avium]|uniref:hypothetical protein n=2 Tax=Enterococcus TaxID=1350 RepID=UPI002891124D|nr:hypothetical protein [Enterococcus avium]MDT2429292.1 hypothetical protein [Enterococcus avium]